MERGKEKSSLGLVYLYCVKRRCVWMGLPAFSSSPGVYLRFLLGKVILSLPK